MSACDSALQIDPNYAYALREAAIVHDKRGDFKRAFEVASRAISIEPQNEFGYNNRCYYLFRLERYNEAIPDCNRAIELDPQYNQPYYNRAEVYKKLGQPELARQDYRAILGRKPNDAEARQELAALEKKVSPSVVAAAAPPRPAPATAPSASLPSTPRLERPSPQQAPSERRVAFVVGNARYGAGADLANPQRDAGMIAASLRAIGFEVVEIHDVDQRALRSAIRDFGAKLERAGAGAVALFYFSGHGMQVRGENYLIPIGAQLDREADVPVEAVLADEVLRQMEYAGSRVNILILDACRNNPLSRGFRSMDRGLARMDGPRGTLIAYATAPGQVAADGAPGAGSPYSAALARAIRQPGRAAEEVFRSVRQEVLKVTGERQIPWESSSLTEAFYFVP